MTGRLSHFPEALRLAVGDVVLTTATLDADLVSFGNAACAFYGEERESIRIVIAKQRVTQHARHGALLLSRNGHSKRREVNDLIERACTLRLKRHGAAHALVTLDLVDMVHLFTTSHLPKGSETLVTSHMSMNDATSDLQQLADRLNRAASEVRHAGMCLLVKPNGWRQ